MLTSTINAIRAVLQTDETITARDRTRLLALVRQGREAPRSEPALPPRPRVISRTNTSERLVKSLRFVDRLAQDGILKRVKMPGRKRAIGFLESDVEALIAGRQDNDPTLPINKTKVVR